ncbi:MAG: penicillin-binding protein 2 [Oscillospiraceae bacterium]|nr:penicillin-binding protein 2 [Oscillospiraceae bacterium]
MPIHRRLYSVAGFLMLCFFLLIFYLTLLMRGSQYLAASIRQSQTTLTAGYAQGTIYDRNFTPLVNAQSCWFASAVPTPETVGAILPHTLEMQPVLEALRTGRPFLCRVDTPEIPCPGVHLLTVPDRGQGHHLAQHVLGYTLENVGVTGLESDFDDLLRGAEDPAQITYTVDARGKALAGVPPVVQSVQNRNGGVVTTLDARIQALCEAQPLEKGAIVVMDVQTGELLAMASFPTYAPDALGSAISDENAPLINRCLCPYSVGSIFKLVTSAAAYRQYRTHFITECTGTTEISGQTFRCHDHNGHGVVDMKRAMIYSCNSYFIELSTRLDPAGMRETAQLFGFGTQFALTKSILSQSGTLPTPDDLTLPAEMANFCFGQGKLTATPLQVTQMTCAIANNGKMPIASLIRGFTADGTQLTEEREPRCAYPIDRKTAYFLQDLMIAAVNANEKSNAAPSNVFAAGKTSTAQTGRYDENGVEYCHGWITGYFPIDKPRYAVTVLAEDGGYGNDAAAPVFRELAEQITELEHLQTASPAFRAANN